MRNSFSNLLFVAVIFAFATGIPSSGNSASYKKMSEKECREEVGKFIKRRGLSSKENYGITQRYCDRGDYKGAINAIEKAKPIGKPPRKTSEKECLSKLGKHIKTMGFKPDREAYRTAQRYCAKGDYKGAINAIEKAKPTGKPPRKTSEKECLSKLGKHIKTMGFKPDREAYRTAQRYCAKGDYKGAINAIEKAK